MDSKGSFEKTSVITSKHVIDTGVLASFDSSLCSSQPITFLKIQESMFHGVSYLPRMNRSLGLSIPLAVFKEKKSHICLKTRV